MTIFDLFSGIGGFSRAFQKAGATIVGCAETDRYAAAIYRYHFREVQNYGDATRIDTNEIPNFDCLCAGFPCQDFSTAGRRDGLEGLRGTLFFEIIRILRDKRPRYFLLENVPGLLSSGDYQDFPQILGNLTECGYGVQWSVVNSKDFGVPQNRERVYIVGHLRTESRSEVFTLGDGDAFPPETHRTEQGQTQQSACVRPGGMKGSSETYIQCFNPESPQRQRVYSIDGVAATLATSDGKGGALQIGYDIANRAELTQTNRRIRRLTVVECERLQAYPDGYTQRGIDENGQRISISNTQRYKCLGNAVTVSVVYEIAKKLQEVNHG